MKQTTTNFFTLITGASSGIGKALAKACARREMNLALVDLPGTELLETVDYLRNTYRVKVYHLGVDLMQTGASEKVMEWIQHHQLPVNMLINNAGIGFTSSPEKFSSESYQKQILVNLTSLTLLTRLLISELKRYPTAYIFNLNSLNGIFFAPFKHVNAGTNPSVINFSESLRDELRDTGIHVSVLCPGGIIYNSATGKRQKNPGRFFQVSAFTYEYVAEEAIVKLLQKQSVVIPGRWNRFLITLDKIVPAFLTNKIIQSEFKKPSRAH